MYEDMTYSFNQMVKEIEISTLTEDELGDYKISLSGENLERNVVPSYHRSLGRCHTLSLTENIRKRGVRYVQLNL